jgi:hypothetical protein
MRSPQGNMSVSYYLFSGKAQLRETGQISLSPGGPLWYNQTISFIFHPERSPENNNEKFHLEEVD